MVPTLSPSSSTAPAATSITLTCPTSTFLPERHLDMGKAPGGKGGEAGEFPALLAERTGHGGERTLSAGLRKPTGKWSTGPGNTFTAWAASMPPALPDTPEWTFCRPCDNAMLLKSLYHKRII